jgi:hypothetical protein
MGQNNLEQAGPFERIKRGNAFGFAGRIGKL